MKKLCCAALVLLTSSYLPMALADDGASINISGTVRDNTCYLSPDSQSKTVQLGDTQLRRFSEAGDTSRDVPFIINLEKCGSQTSTVTVTFSGTADQQNPDLLGLDSGDGAAGGLAIGLYDSAKDLIPMGKESGNYTVTAGKERVPLLFYARLVATSSNVTAGSATATATFVLNYA